MTTQYDNDKNKNDKSASGNSDNTSKKQMPHQSNVPTKEQDVKKSEEERTKKEASKMDRESGKENISGAY